MTTWVSRMLTLRRGILLLAVSIVVAAPSVFGQANAAPNGAAPPAVTDDVRIPVFDVVSVKQNKSGNGMMRIMNKPDGFSGTNIPAKMLLQLAYGIRQDLISGGPGWADSTGYDIDAKVAGPDVEGLKKLSPKQRASMLQPLLADRFKLTVHTETKQLPVFELVAAKGGSKLKEASPGDTYANGIKGPDGSSRAGMIRVGPGQLTAQAAPIGSLVTMLSQQLQKTVIDKTGLAGKYDVELTWAPEQRSDAMFKGSDSSQARAEPAPDAAGPSIFTALQEQLGLRLQSTKGPVDTLVIDHIEMPSEN